MSTRRDLLVRLLRERTVLIMLVLITLGTSAVLWNMRMSTALTRETAIQNAAAYSAMLREFRTLYTSEVVVPTQGTLDARHDYAEHANAIPLPATMTIALGDRIALDKSGVEVHLYSEYPFPWRVANGGLRDDFRREAWATLTASPGEPFYRIEEVEGRSLLRYASADVLRPACVECHNTHPDTPKDDWRVGQVRGVLEVDYPMELVDQRQSMELVVTTAFVTLTLLGFGLLSIRLYRETQRAETANAELGARTHELTNLLDNMGQAVFMIDAEHKIVAPVSKHAEVVVDGALVGRSIDEVLYRDLPRDGDVYARVQQTLAIVFGADELQWSLAADQLPHQLSYQPADPDLAMRPLRVTHSPVWDAAGRLERILFVIEDVSDLDALERELERVRMSEDRTRVMLSELASAGELVAPMFGEVVELLSHAARLGPELAGSARARLELCRYLHTLKGNARTLGLSRLSAAAHRAEARVEALAGSDSDGALTELDASLAKLRSEAAEYSRLARHVFNVDTIVIEDPNAERGHDPGSEDPLDPMRERLHRLVAQLAERQGKQVKLVFEGLEQLGAGARLKPIEDALGHLLRNAVDHGIEGPAERRASDKPERGRIQVDVSSAGEHLQLVLEDDGRGIDVARLIEAALERGQLTGERAATLERGAALDLVFVPLLSTRAQVDEISGRGVGLDAVATIVAELGGTIEVDSKPNAGTRFAIVLPAAAAET